MTNDILELLRANRSYTETLKTHFDKYDPGDRDGFRVILQLALRNGVTRQQLKDTFGVSAGTISRWESGETAPIEVTRQTVVSHLSKMIEPVDAGLCPA